MIGGGLFERVGVTQSMTLCLRSASFENEKYDAFSFLQRVFFFFLSFPIEHVTLMEEH
jgi:hypothetical protein